MEREFNSPAKTTPTPLDDDKDLFSKGNGYAGWDITWAANHKIAVEIRDVHVTLMNDGNVTFTCTVTSYNTDERQVRGQKPGCAIVVYYKDSSGGSLDFWNTGIIPVDCNYKNKTVFMHGNVNGGIYNDVVKCVPEISHGYYYHCDEDEDE